ISAVIFASAMGAGVLFSALAVGLYQGTITLLAVFVAPFVSDVLIAQMSFIGSVLITGIGINILKMAKIKVGDMLPAMFMPVIYHVIRLFI
ncbi:MAG: DUF554 family protein, partial [Eubacteriales bacterium]|nr:DUF554 family protein [Eubacteriales bacterium]